MSAPDHMSDDLPRLLTGDATREEVMIAAEHLRMCPDCRQELVSTVVGHASLTSAHRFAPEIVASLSRSTDDDVPVGPLPDMSAIFAKVRAEAATTSGRKLPRRRWLVAAAAAVVMAGAGVTIAETVGSGSSSKVAAQTVRLQPVGSIRAAATATISAGRMRIDAAALPELDPSRQYEVWLANGTGSSLRPLGYVGTDRTAELPAPTSVLARYSYIAISIQKTDQIAFSGDMIVRGRYT
jgi:predicted anti-sigma-YlaC factor YlaD